MTSAGKSQRLMIKILTLLYFPHTQSVAHTPHTSPHITCPASSWKYRLILGSGVLKQDRWNSWLVGWMHQINLLPRCILTVGTPIV